MTCLQLGRPLCVWRVEGLPLAPPTLVSGHVACPTGARAWLWPQQQRC